MKEETNNSNYNIGDIVLATDGDSFKVLGFVSTKRNFDGNWVYTVCWDDGEHGEEPYSEKDIDNFWDCLQQELNS